MILLFVLVGLIGTLVYYLYFKEDSRGVAIDPHKKPTYTDDPYTDDPYTDEPYTGCVQDVVLLPRTDCIVDPRDPKDPWHGYVMTEVYQQGSCGSCQAFAAATVIQDCYNLKHQQNIVLSPQLLLDAMGRHRQPNGTMVHKCNGNTFFNVFSAAQDRGVGIMDTCDKDVVFGTDIMAALAAQPLRYSHLNNKGEHVTFPQLNSGTLTPVTKDISTYRAATWRYCENTDCQTLCPPNVGCLDEDGDGWWVWDDTLMRVVNTFGCRMIKIKTWGIIARSSWPPQPEPDYEQKALEYLQQHGPVYCTLIITQKFFAQQNANILDDSEAYETDAERLQDYSDNNDNNHALSIIGYGTDEAYIPPDKTVPEKWEYWIIRNSWGTNVHKHGIFCMRRNVNAFGITQRNIVGVKDFIG